MKKQKLFAMMTLILAMGLAACGGKTSSKESEKPSSAEPTPSSEVTPSSSSEAPQPSTSAPQSSSSSQSSRPSSSSSAPDSSSSSSAPDSSSSQPASSSELPPEPQKAINVTESVLVNEGGKVYVKVTGTQENHTADEFKWAWGVKENGESGAFVDGSAEPAAADFEAATFDANNQFVLKYCLTDIEALASGKFYRIYGGTPATYGDIAFTNNETAARDASRNYYLRQDQSYSFVFDSIQPIEFKLATIADVAEADLPEGVTNAGAYLKIGGANEAGLTMETINAWNEAGKIAGNFQRCRGGGYQLHNHVASERFWKIEGDNVFFYLYVGWMAVGEGWQTHFDCVSGNAGANLQFDDVVLTGDIEYKVGDFVYRVFADKSKGSSGNDFYGCVGVTKEKWVDPTAHVHAYPDDADAEYAKTDDYIATRAYNCTGTCGESVLRWYALDFDETLSSGTSKVKVNGASENNAVKTGNAENDGGNGNANPKVSVGNHYVYKVNVSEAVEKAGLAFQIYSRSDDRQVFKAQDNDGKNGNYYDEATETFTKAPARYGVRINGQEVYFDEALLAEEVATPKNSLVWRDFPLNSFALNKGVNTIDVYSMAGYSQAGILQFQLTGLPKVAVTHKHTLGEWQSDENNHWKECSGEDCTLAAHAHLQEAAHEWGDKYDEVAATCEAKGSYKQACKVCGYVKTVETAKADHTWAEGTPANNTDGFAVTPLSCSCGKVGAKMAVDSFTGNTKTNSTYKHDNNTTVTYKIVVSKAGNYELKIGAFVANNRTKDLSAAPYTVKVGTGDNAVNVPVSSGTYEELGIGTNSAKLFVLCPTIALAEGENVIALTQGGGGYRLTFGGDLVVAEL